jgi:hypothetical protein
VLYGKLRRDIHEIIKRLCYYKQIEILERSYSFMCKNSTFMGYLKGKSTLMIEDIICRHG